jgi:hypothetical protein
MTLRTVSTANDFKQHWSGIHNFAMAGECVPFDMELPPVDVIVDTLRRDDAANINSSSGEVFRRTERRDIRDEFRAMPIEKALEQSFGLAHYDLPRFDTPGGLLEGLDRQVLRPWRQWLESIGFELSDFFRPYFFISGANCATAYHMDLSHVLAWQLYGEKQFCSFKDPLRWADETVRREQLVGGQNAYNQPIPDGITGDDVVAFDMKPGDVLWNVLQTPHWVKAGADVAVSMNISHRGLRLHGELCPHEQQLQQWRTTMAT